MNLKLYNTLSGKKETFKPIKNGKVNLFVCGITPYDFAHLGHARTYIIFDIIAGYLREKGFNLFYLQNITDIDDKIINRAKERKTTTLKLARFFEKEYLKDMKNLKIDNVTKYARATEHIKEIISQVERLLKNGFAYQIDDGIYYDISKFKDYGKLSRRTVLQAEDAVSRIDEAKEKRNKGDFCLWKKSKTGEPKWKSPWFSGRPGWHIEDTAITEKYFGPQYDIHGGGRDLIFPHHEAEIAQMEAISGKKPLVKYWLHSGFLTVKGQKMAKSLGNFITIKDFVKKQSPRLLRFLVLKNHYRSPLDYDETSVLQAKRELERIDEFVEKLKTVGVKHSIKARGEDEGEAFSDPPHSLPRLPRSDLGSLGNPYKKFESAMEDDFNTSKAVAVIFELINKGSSLIVQNKLVKNDAKNILEFLRKIDKVFNFIFWKKPKEKIPTSVLNIVKLREKYRKEGKWQKADKIRKKIKELGYQIKDTKEGPKIKIFR